MPQVLQASPMRAWSLATENILDPSGQSRFVVLSISSLRECTLSESARKKGILALRNRENQPIDASPKADDTVVTSTRTMPYTHPQSFLAQL